MKLAGLLVLLLAGSLPAQGVVWPAPDCNIGRMAYENYTDHWGFRQPRVAIHAERMIASWALTKVAGKVVPKKVAKALPFTVRLSLHVRGAFVKKHYPFHPMDWVGDSWLALTPVVGWKWELLGYPLLTACWSSP